MGAAERLWQRLANLAGRAVVKLTDDSQKIQRVQLEVLAGELRDLVQRVQPYGFTSVPLAGAHPVVLLCPFGDRAQALAFVDDVRYRPSGGAPGDSELYDNRGNRVRLRAGVLEITAAADLAISVAGAGTLTISGGATVNVTGAAAVNVSGDATLTTGGTLHLGGPGGAGVARIGDAVNLVSGLIIGGSAKVKAVA